MLVLFEHTEKRMVDRLKLEAGFHGIKLDDDAPQSQGEPKRASKAKGVPGDPDSYSHLSMEERQRLTEQMMGNHKAWAEVDQPLGGKEGIDKR